MMDLSFKFKAFAKFEAYSIPLKNKIQTGILLGMLLLAFTLISFVHAGKHTASLQHVPAESDEITVKTIVLRMISETEALKTLSFNLRIQERGGGNSRNSTSFIKIQRNPRKVYMKLNGPELLFVAGWNGGKVLVNPGGFPYININLDGNSSTLHKDQHHTINEVGFDYLIDIIQDAVKKSGDNFNTYFKYEGEVEWNKTTCYKVIIADANYRLESYITKKNESLISIARKLKLSEFKRPRARA